MYNTNYQKVKPTSKKVAPKKPTSNKSAPKKGSKEMKDKMAKLRGMRGKK